MSNRTDSPMNEAWFGTALAYESCVDFTTLDADGSLEQHHWERVVRFTDRVPGDSPRTLSRVWGETAEAVVFCYENVTQYFVSPDKEKPVNR